MTTKNKKSLRVIIDREHYRLVNERGVIINDVSRFLCALETRGLSPHTIRAYAYDLLALYRWLFEREKEPRIVENLKHNDLLEFVRVQQQNNAKPSSINRRLVVAELLYRFLTGEHIGAGNAASRGVSLPAPHYRGRGKDRELGLNQIRAPRYRTLRVKAARKLVEPLTPEQARMLISSFRRYRDVAITYLMLLCGLRSQEVLSLNVRDVDFAEHRLRVKGKGNKERFLPGPTLLLKYLHNYLRLERPPYCMTSSLFVVLQGQKRGHAMTTSGLRSLFRFRRRDEQIACANPHRLRHTFGTDMARAGVRLQTLQKMMGHSTSTMTLQYINLSMADIAVEFLRAAKEIQKRYTRDEARL